MIVETKNPAMEIEEVTHLYKTCWPDNTEDHQPRIDLQDLDSYKLRKI